MAGHRALILLLLTCLTAPLVRAAEKRAWRLQNAATGTSLRFGSFPLLLHSQEYEAGVLTLRVSLRNLSGAPAAPPLPVEQGGFTLQNEATKATRECVTMSEVWKQKPVLLAQPSESVEAELKFQIDHTWLDQPLTLLSTTHAPLAMDLTRQEPFTPPDLTPLEGQTFAIGETLAPMESGNRDVSLRVGQMRWAEGRLTVELIFTNIARYSFQMDTCPRGSDALLRSASGQRLTVREVRGGIIDRIAPPGVWAPGQEVRGMVSFATPHPHVAERLWFQFPGYPPVPLLLDLKKAAYRVDDANRQTPGLTIATHLSQQEQKVFDSVTQFWAGVSKEVMARTFDTALHHFDMEQAPELFNGIESMAFDAFEITPEEEQSMQVENGELRLIHVDLRYRLKDQRGTNAFILPMYCRMVAAPDGTWIVKALTFPRKPPFWARGFTQTMKSEHFQVIHKDLASDRTQARQTALALEEAYRNLQRAGLPVSATYVAFHCSSEGDFQILSGADPAFAGGAAPGQPIQENGRLSIYNLAIYANDTTYRNRHALGDQSADRMIMLQHELAHLVVGDSTRPWSPAWLVEGLAVYFSGETMRQRPDLLTNAMRNGLTLRSITEDSHLRPDNGNALGLYLKYQLSARVVQWIAREHGPAKLLSLYQAFAAEFPEPWQRSNPLYHSDEQGPEKKAARLRLAELIVQRHLGTTLERIEAAVFHEALKERP